MKYQRHKRKESFSVLLISNTDRSSRQFQISLFSIRLVFLLLLITCIAVGWLIYQVSTGHGKQKELRSQLASQKQQTQQLEAENKTLRQTTVQQEAQLEKQTEKPQTVAEEAPESQTPKKDSTFPILYPSQGSGVLASSYSPEQPYLIITTYTGSHIIAAGDGTVVSITSNEVNKHIIEIQHESGYTTRYFCHQDAELQVTEGAQVSAGTILLNITTDNTQFDYQVFYGGSTVDPFTIIDAKG